jgi:Baseplate J-like protein
MALPQLNLDDRDFESLRDEARLAIARTCPEWTDLSPGDPGMVLLELFAHLTEVMIYRLNRLPDKAYIEFLNLIGVFLQPPAAAAVELQFSRPKPADAPVEIPRGTRVTVARATGGSEQPVFATARPVAISAGQTTVDVTAYHAAFIEGELAGHGTSMPRLTVVAKHPPIVAPTGTDLDLIVGVEAERGEMDERAPAVRYQGRTYRVWREVSNFTNLPPDALAYVADRATGTISFAPALRMMRENGALEDVPLTLAAVPAATREIRLWYWRGGGPEGNVAAGTLTTLKDPIPGVTVTNRGQAVGGRAAETLDNALLRGPHEFHSLQRAVTAADFELLAQRSSGAVARAKAFTKSVLWTHAAPGTVEVVLVPAVSDREPVDGPLPAAHVREYYSETARDRIQQVLDERKPVATTVLVTWVRCKTVHVKASIVAYREEDATALKQRVLKRLYRTISPLSPTWRFGQALRASHVYDIILSEPGVNYVEDVRLIVNDVPDTQVASLAVDGFQKNTWYAASGEALFRSLNDGDGWEEVSRFPGDTVLKVCAHPGRPGLVAVATRLAGQEERCGFHLSFDCGETWTLAVQMGFRIEDLAWMTRDSSPVVLMATSVGLYEFTPGSNAMPVQVLVDPADANRGFTAVAVATDVRGGGSVSVASYGGHGIYLSTELGRSNTFANIGLAEDNVRALAVQHDGPRTFLWATFTASAGDPGTGAAMVELVGSKVSAEGWRRYSKGWSEDARHPGSCWALGFRGLTVFAGSHQGGVLRLDLGQSDPGWQAPAIDSGLPHREVGRIFQPVQALAVNREDGLLLCAGPTGVYRSGDGGATFEPCSSRELSGTRVTLPDTWLFCSAEHDVIVGGEGDSRRD